MTTLGGKLTLANQWPNRRLLNTHDSSDLWISGMWDAGRGSRMADYRIYRLDGAGRIGLADWIQADTDEAAIAETRKLRPDANICEIWQKERLVARLDHDGQAVLPDRP